MKPIKFKNVISASLFCAAFVTCSFLISNPIDAKMKTSVYSTDIESLQTHPEGEITLDSTDPHTGIRTIEYKPAGVCSQLIHIELTKKNIINNVVFTKGCNGNAKGIGALLKGMTVKEAIKRLDGIKCGKKQTSCPDQLAFVLKKISSK